MLYVLDTNVLSDLAKWRPNPNLLGWLNDVDPLEIAVPLSAIFEVQYGIDLARECHPETSAEKEAWLESLLLAQELNLMLPTVEEWRLRGRMCATPALKNFMVQCPYSTKLKTGEDITIAAAAIIHDACLVTFNESDFRLIHEHFPLPAIFHPGRLEWIVKHSGWNRPLRAMALD